MVNWKPVLPYLVLLLVLPVLKCTYDGRRRAEGREAIAVAARQIAEDSLGKVLVRRDTLYVRDTVPRWRTIRETQTLLDTLRLSDTVTLTVRESVIVFAADSAIQACREIVFSCEARVAVRDSLLSVLTTDRDFWRRKSQPSLLTKISTAAKWLAIGYVVGVSR